MASRAAVEASDSAEPRISIPAWAWLTCASLAGLAYARSFGNLESVAIGMIALALALALPAAFWSQRWIGRSTPAWMGSGALGAALVWFFFDLFERSPGMYLFRLGPRGLTEYHAWVCAAAVLAGLSLGTGKLHAWAGAGLLAVFGRLGHWMISAAPNPTIDVFVFQKMASESLLKLQNPYALRFPDIYGDSPFYGPGVSVNGVLRYGFPYLPEGLLPAAWAQSWLGDYRYACLLAMVATGALLMFFGKSAWARGAVALWLFSPRTIYVLEQGWTEPLVGLAVVLACLGISRSARAKGLGWALLLGIKQYLVFALPFAWAWTPKAERRTAFLWTVGLAAGLALPFVLWNPLEFYRSVVEWQFVQPFRLEALSFPALAASRGKVFSPFWAFPFAAAAAALCTWRLPKHAAGFAAAVATTLLVFFAFNKQAFSNYYFFVQTAFTAAAALWPGRATSHT